MADMVAERDLRGLALPITRWRGEYWSSKTLPDLVWSNLLIALFTPKNSRPMMPTFGSDIATLCFDPNDSVLAADLEKAVRDAAAQWCRLIVVEEVIVTADIQYISVQVVFRMGSDPNAKTKGFVVKRNTNFDFIKAF